MEFSYDISCPYAYIASTRVGSLATRTATAVVWRPVLLGAIYRATAAPQGAAGSASDVFNDAKKSITSIALMRTLRRYGVPYRQPLHHPQKTVNALRLLHFLPNEYRAAVSAALFKAYWVEGKDVNDCDFLLSLARESGAPGTERLTKGVFEDAGAREGLERATADAVERGAPGVPAFWIAEEVWTDYEGRARKGRLYWGQDRMHFVEASLSRLVKQSYNLKGLIPRCKRPRQGLENPVQVEFWYDFSSPWAFLGWTQLERMKETFGSRLEIVMKPLLLGALFREIGAPMIPSAAISKQKRVYSRQDHADWVSFWNEVNKQEGSPYKPIDFYWTDHFPIRSPALLRCAIVEPQCVPVLFRACWELNLDMADESVLQGVLDNGGFDGASLVAKAKAPDVKNQLFQCTAAAKDAGLCGVPSYRVFRGVPDGPPSLVGGVVWGQDEIGVIEDLVSGWDEDDLSSIAQTSPHNGTAKPYPRL